MRLAHSEIQVRGSASDICRHAVQATRAQRAPGEGALAIRGPGRAAAQGARGDPGSRARPR